MSSKEQLSGNVNTGFSNSESDVSLQSKDHSPSSIQLKKNDFDNDVTTANTRLHRTILKNIILISITFMVLFTSFQSMASLQSSINQVDGLGTYSLSIIYGALIISSQFTPSLILKYLGSKWTMVFSMFCYSLYIAAQFHPQVYTLLPAAFILGVAAAPLWIAKCAYL